MQRNGSLAGWVTACLVFAMAPVVPAQNREPDHQALRQLLVSMQKAINSNDLKSLEPFLARGFVFTGVDQTLVTNAAGMAAYFGRMVRPDAPVARVEMAPQAGALTRFVGPDAGYCFGTSLDTYTLKDGRKFRIPSRWTAVVVREGGAWKAAAIHLGVNFLDNPVLTARSLSVWRRIGIALRLAEPPYERP